MITPDFDSLSVDENIPESLVLKYYKDDNGSKDFRDCVNDWLDDYGENESCHILYEYLIDKYITDEIFNIIGSTSVITNDDKNIFFASIIKQNFTLMQELINKGFNINTIFKNTNDTPIYVAIGTNSLDMCKFLIEKGCEIGNEINSGIINIIFRISTDYELFYYFASFPDMQNTIITHINDPDIYNKIFNLHYRTRNIDSQIKKIEFLIEMGLSLKNCPFGEIRNFSYNCDISRIIYFINNGLVLDNTFLIDAIMRNNTELISFGLSNGLSFDQNVCKDIFNKRNSEYLSLLLNYDCDLSYIINEQSTYTNFAKMFDKYQIDNSILLNYIFTAWANSVNYKTGGKSIIRSRN